MASNVNDFYAGILKPGSQGGLFQPGPPVMLPPQGMGGGQSDPAALGAALLQGKTTNPSAAGSIIPNKDPSQLPQMAYNDVPTWAPWSNMPAVGAINQATQPMNWETSNPGATAGGDPWATMRAPGQSSAIPQQGMVTANTGRNIASHLPPGSPIEGLFTGGLGGMFANTPIGQFIHGLGALAPPKSGGGLAALPAAPQGSYDPRKDVTNRDPSAGGWGINSGGGIVPF